ncbi:MAG TPA: LysM peptidoglycan-binding domain-containing protein [Chryseosolibacter sp.]|nr:LysM peptidoglycan-binding domain-containing protein [Chryseosolibacter sp.]
MRSALLFLLFTIFSTTTFAQISQDSIPSEADLLIIDSLEVAAAEEEMIYKEDTADFVYFYLPTELEYVPGDDHPEIISDRLACVEKKIPLVYNDKIHAFINYFTVKDRDYTRMMMRRKNLYFPIFEKYLAKYGLPDELKYLSIIESGLNPRATSRVRAVGLWQFMSATGRYYGLNHDWYIDERMDPEKATDAACRYLRDLYRMFDDWELALAAYNTGPGNVKKAIRRSGYKKTFWQIYPHLPRETRSYVPQFVAIIYTMNYLGEHNFIDEGDERHVESDTIHVRRFLNFETFASMTGSCLEDLQKLNPSIQRNVIPENGKTFTMVVPTTAKLALEKNRFAILDSASRSGRKQIEALAKAAQNSYGGDRVVYKVRSGDVLGSIALRHRVTVANIKKWNHLKSNTIRTGQRLTIWTKGSGPRSTSVASSSKSKSAAAYVQNIKGAKTYTVQPGDTLWDISRKFDGLTIEKIKQLNNLSNSRIKAGQKLIVGI